MTSRTRALALVTLVCVGALSGFFVGPTAADATGSATVDVTPNGSGQEGTYNVSSSPGQESGSLDGFRLTFNESAPGLDLSNVTTSDVVIGVDDDGDGEISPSEEATDWDHIEVTNGGRTITFYFGGSTSMNGNPVIAVFNNTTNPEAGTYNVSVDINPQSSGAPSQTQVTFSDATPPEITRFDLVSSNQDVDLVVNASEQLGTLDASLTNDAGGSLAIGEFNETDAGDHWSYRADVSSNTDGDFEAVLDAAADTKGNAIQSPSQSDTATVDTVPIVIDSGAVTPESVDSGTTTSQTVDLAISGASVDGSDETVSVTFNGSVDVRNATASTTASGSAGTPTLSDADGDGVNETISVDVDSGDGGGTDSYNVTFDLNVSYDGAGGGTTVPIDATADDSDDDDSDSVSNVTSVAVNDVTPPEITNFTLVATGQDVDLTFNASEELGAVSVGLGGDASGQLSLSDLNATDHGDHWSYSGDVSQGQDGTFTAQVSSAADTAGNQADDSDSDTLAVNEVPIDVVNATVTNATVDPESTVAHTVTVDVDDVSLDGQSDTVRLTFPDASQVSVTGVSATNATVNDTSTTNLGSDADNETVDVTLDTGDGGGTTDVSVTYDLSVTYPDSAEGQTFPVNASAFDSDGDTDAETNLTQVRVRNTVPTITNFTLTADNQDVDLSFNSTEELADVEVSLTEDRSGQTLTDDAGDFTVTQQDGVWTYTADVHEGEDGQFNASITTAVDNVGNSADGDRQASVRVNETDPVVVSATSSPSPVDPATTLSQNVTVSVDGFSKDGSDDTVTVELGNGTRIQSVSAAGTSYTVTDATVVDADGDGANESVRVTVDSGDEVGTADVTLDIDATVRYPDALEGDTLEVNATASDSDGASDSASNLTQIRVRNTVPVITNFTLVNDGRDVDLSFNSSEELSTIGVDLTGDAGGSLDASNFTESEQGDHWTYHADVSDGQDGSFNATLSAAIDNAGNDGAEGETDTLVVNTRPIDVTNATISNSTVDPESTVNHTVTVDVADASLDGGGDTVRFTFPNATSVSLAGASAGNETVNVTSVQSADGDGDAETVVAEVASGSGGGTTDLTVTFDVSTTYPDALEGSTLDLNASATDSDGDSDTETNLTQVRVRNTVPEISNFTLVNSSRDVDLSFESTEALSEIQVTLGGDVSGTLSESNVTATESNGNWTYRADVSDGNDGSFNATLDTAKDNVGNDGAEGEYDALTVDTRDVELLAVNVTPATVDPDATVDQTFTVDAADFGRDGGTDSVTVALNESLAVSNVSASSQTSGVSVTGTSLVDADDDGANESVQIALDTGSQGGTTDVTLSLSASVRYPESVEERTLDVDAEATDSDGDVDTETNLTQVAVRGVPPNITAFTVTADGQDVDLSFNSTEQLATIAVDRSGDRSGTLDASDFTESQVADDVWVYEANLSDGQDGVFNASLTAATDAHGNDGAENESDGVRVNETAPVVVSGAIAPDAVDPQTATNQTVSATVTGFSKDGSDDTVHLVLPGAVSLSLADASANGSTTVTGASLADPDGDGNATTVVVTLDTGDGAGTADVDVTADLTATYPDATEGETRTVNATALDSDGASDGPENVTTVRVRDTVPNVTDFALNATGQDVDVSFESDEAIRTAEVTLGDDATGSLSRANLTERHENGTWHYVGDVSAGEDGEYNVTLVSAVDNAGNDGADNETANVTVDTVPIDVVNATIVPDVVGPGTALEPNTVDQTVTVHVTNASADGRDDAVAIHLDDALDLSVESVSTTASGGIAGNATLEDADGDGHADSVRVPVDAGDGGGTVDLAVTYDLSVAYDDATEGQTYAVDAAARDGDGDEDTAPNATAVRVRDTVPNVTAFDVAVNGSNVTLSVHSTERLETLRVALRGPTGGNLTVADFTESADGDGYVYTTVLAEGRQGTYFASLSAAVDNAGNDGAEGEADSATYRVSSGGGQQRADDPEEQRNETTTRERPYVTVEGVTAGDRVIVENARPDLTVLAHLAPDAAEEAAGMTLSDVELTTERNGTATLLVTGQGERGSLPAVPSDHVDPGVFYRVTGDGVGDTTLTFRVDDDRLGDRTPEDVRIYGYAAGDWTLLNATYVGERVDTHAYRVETDAAAYAVGLVGANVSVTNATLVDATTESAGENATATVTGTAANRTPTNRTATPATLTVNATVTNTGIVAGNLTVNVTADGEVVATRNVSVPANATRTVSFSLNRAAVEGDGAVVLAVNGVRAGVLRPGKAQDTGTPTASSRNTRTTGDSPFAVAALVVALLGAALLARRTGRIE